MSYATTQQADVLAISRGETDFVTSDDKSVSALVNGSFSSTATVILLDGLTTPSGITLYDLLQIGTELLQVTAITYGTPTDATCTVTRGYDSTTAAALVNNAPINVKNLSKIRLLQIASADIVNYTRQVLFNGFLWLQGNDNMAQACSIQAIYLLTNLEARNLATFIKNITNGSYADTVLSIKPAAGEVLAPEAATMIDYLLQQLGVSQGEYQRA